VDSRPLQGPLASNAERGSATKNIYDDDAFASPPEELLSIVGAAGAATNDVPGVSANLEAAEMAQIFVGRMHRPCNVRVVLANDALRRSAVQLLLTRNPMVFEYAISVVALLLAGHGDAGRAAVVAELGKLDEADAAGALVVREHVASRQVREHMPYVYCLVCRGEHMPYVYCLVCRGERMPYVFCVVSRGERMTYVYYVVCRCVVCGLWCVECSTWRRAR